MWFDSHCHLHICEEREPAEAVVARARDAGVTRMIAIGIDVASSDRALELARLDGVWASAGVHPNSADEWNDDAALRIDSLLAEPRVVAVGETGLDFYRDYVVPDTQRAAFGDHIELAKKHDAALVIHTRDSLDETLEVLENAGPPARLVFHCWSGDEKQLGRALALGAYASFAGNVSFNSAGDLRAAAKRVPGDRILVETDSPYLTPVPHRGKLNEPGYVVFVGRAVAEARGESPDRVADTTTNNALRLFGIERGAGSAAECAKTAGGTQSGPCRDGFCTLGPQSK